MNRSIIDTILALRHSCLNHTGNLTALWMLLFWTSRQCSTPSTTEPVGKHCVVRVCIVSFWTLVLLYMNHQVPESGLGSSEYLPFSPFQVLSFTKSNCREFFANDEWLPVHLTSVHWIIRFGGDARVLSQAAIEAKNSSRV